MIKKTHWSAEINEGTIKKNLQINLNFLLTGQDRKKNEDVNLVIKKYVFIIDFLEELMFVGFLSSLILRKQRFIEFVSVD